MRRSQFFSVFLIVFLASSIFLVYTPEVKAVSYFGKTDIGGSDYTFMGYGDRDEKLGCLYTLSESGSISSVSFYLKDYSGVSRSDSMYFGIYNSSGDLEGQTEVGTIPSSFQWVTLDFGSPLSLNADDYYIAALVSYRVEIKYASGDADQTIGDYPDDIADGMSDPFGSAEWTNAWATSIYASYTTGGDTTSPTYSSVGHNNTVAGNPTNFYFTSDDDVALHPNGQFILSTNNTTPSWSNETAVNFTSTPESVSDVLTLNSTEGLIIGYKFYFYDNAGNGNSTNIYTLTTTNESATVLFEAYHETGDLSEYDTSDNATASTDTAHHGSYSLKVTNQSGTDTGYASAAFNPNTTHYFIRWFLNFTRWPVDNQEHYWFVLGNGSQGIAVGNVGRDDGTEIYVYSADFFEEKEYNANQTVVENTWYEYQLEIQQGVNGTASATLSIDGVETSASATGTEIFADGGELTFNWGINNIPSETGDNCTWYFDCVTVSTQELPTDTGGAGETDLSHVGSANLAFSNNYLGNYIFNRDGNQSVSFSADQQRTAAFMTLASSLLSYISNFLKTLAFSQESSSVIAFVVNGLTTFTSEEILNFFGSAAISFVANAVKSIWFSQFGSGSLSFIVNGLSDFGQQLFYFGSAILAFAINSFTVSSFFAIGDATIQFLTGSLASFDYPVSEWFLYGSAVITFVVDNALYGLELLQRIIATEGLAGAAFAIAILAFALVSGLLGVFLTRKKK